ncbi:GNAT family N-acetyltransferase [Paracoccus sp. (in: a-proteobacteria)]|uniref:GNAT family N-acetyltransferase n=1 Tax=Paracoccus sp. TaxID=267 RepID=UPI003A8BA3DD
MTPDAMTALHARCFGSTPRPWSADEFAGLLATSGTFLLSEPAGFLLGRVVLDEAELLTLAVDPDARRHGMGRRLTVGFADASRDRGARSAFLEVAADNAAAQALYLGLGWRPAGLRRGYYTAALDALILRLGL